MIIILGLIVLVAAVVVAVVGVLANGGAALAGRRPDSDDSRWSRLHLFGHRSAPRQAPAPRLAPATQPETLNGQPAPDVPVGASAPAE
jgi:hypothetical protein